MNKPKYCLPFKGAEYTQITQGYGIGHPAVDWAGPYGTFLVAMEDGYVHQIINATTFDPSLEPLERGYGIAIKGDSGLIHSYWHCLPVFPVGLGQKVKQGEIVAQMGNSGFVLSGGEYVPVEIRTDKPYLGTHAHIGVRDEQNQRYNLLDFVDFTLPIKQDLLTAIRSVLVAMGNLLKGR